MSFEVKGCEGITQWIYRWIPYVDVVEPKELREEIKAALGEAIEKFD